VDASAPALALAAENRAAAGLDERVTLLESSWFAALPAGAQFDLIVSNPPYLAAAEWAQAAAEVREHEPKGALVAEEAGLADLRALLQAAPAYLAPGGWIALETGSGQHGGLAALAAAAGFGRTESVADLAGRERFFLAWPAGA